MTSPGSNPFGDLPDPPRSVPTGPWLSEIVKAELVETGPPDPGERISILYLMVWTAGSAVILAFYRQSMSQTTGPESSPMNPPWLQTMYALLMSPLQGAGVASVGLMVWRKIFGGRAFPRQPGHWLLVISGLTSLINWPVYLVVHKLFEGGYSNYLLFYRIPLMIVFCLLAVYAMTRLTGEPRWRKMFLIWIIANTLPVFGHCCLESMLSSNWWVYTIVGVVLPLAFLITAILDRAAGCKRDPLHWAGVACRIAMVWQVVIEVICLFLPRQ
jgi:hypothetical protein